MEVWFADCKMEGRRVRNGGLTMKNWDSTETNLD